MDFIAALLGHMLFFGVFAALIALRSTKVRLVAGRKVLSYPIAMKCLAILGFGILVLGTSYVVTNSHGMERIFVAITLGSMSAIMFLGAVEVFTTRITYDMDCIYQSSIFSRTNSLPFYDVVDVAYSELWSQHLIRDAGGAVVRVSKFMSGAEDLVETTIEHMAAPQRSD